MTDKTYMPDCKKKETVYTLD